MTNKQTRERDYKHEYDIRKGRVKRMVADMDRDKAEQFQKLLQGRGETFITWLNEQIDKELRA